MIHPFKTAAIASLCAIALGAAATTGPSSLAGQSHQIENVAQSDLLRPRDANSANGTPIVLYSHQDWKCMTWKLEAVGDDVRLVNYFTHKTFYPDAAADGSAVTQHPAAKPAGDAEKWRFIPVDGGHYRLEHAATGKTLAVTADGNVVIETYTGAATQQWKLLDKPAKFTG